MSDDRLNKEKDRVRGDLQSYETQKKLKRIAQLGTLAGLGGMGVGGFMGSKKITGIAAAGTLASAFGAGRAAKKSDMSLNRIKRHYDLRSDNNFFNMRAVLPTREEFKKHAMVGGIGEGVIGVANAVNMLAHGGLPVLGASATLALSHLWPSIVDVAATPGLAKWMTNRGFDFAKVFAKQHVGKSLSPAELTMVGKAFKAKGSIARAAANKLPVLGPIDRYFTNFFSGPAGIGSSIGEPAGVVLKHIGEISPRYQDMGLEAINSEPARQVLADVAKQDLATLNKGLDVLKNTRAARLLTRLGKGGAPSLKGLISSIAERPQKLEEIATHLQNLENKGVRGLKTMGVGAGGALLANAFGQSRTRHPLAKDDVVNQIATKVATVKTPVVKPRVDQAIVDTNVSQIALGQDNSQMEAP